ncbi:MAG: M28 family peptidase [Elusimicrobia bacterium]|nr:M28 family peptidase [Elusimicrobiota bacterium]
MLRTTALAAAANGLAAAAVWALIASGFLHRHWLLPSLFAALAYQWALSLPWRGATAWRQAVLHGLAFALILSAAAAPGTLACPEGCAYGLACAAALAGLVFWNHSLRHEPGFWSPRRGRLAAAGSLLWALYLLLFSRQLAWWALDLVFFILALGLWLGRSRALCLVAAVGIFGLATLRQAGDELTVVLLDLLLLLLLFLWESRLPERAPAPPPGRSMLRVGLAGVLLAGLCVYAAGPVRLMVRPELRRAALRALAPARRENRGLTDLAARLRGHVVELSRRIGERSAYEPQAGVRARNYVAGRLRAAGYTANIQEFGAVRRGDFLRREPYANVWARLEARDDGRGLLLVGAHYDAAPGTPGADDNASGVAVLLETARLLRLGPAPRPVVFAAFDAEEPPAFGTRDMGSARFARQLKDRGLRVRGMINLEMLGYFNPRPGSQLFAPLLRPFYPDRGNFVGLAGNVSSLALRRRLARSWSGTVALESVCLPSVFSTLAISDQLNFWSEGFPAVMLSDTAFFRNPRYHQADDTAETLDYESMAAATEALVRALRTGL